jgi:hypothetical protein
MAKAWSKEEIAILREIAASGETLISQMDRLPGRTWYAARSKGVKCGIHFSEATAWTEEEKQILKKIWRGSQSIKLGLKQLPHRSYDAAKGEAQRLGLTRPTKKLGRTGYSYVETVIAGILAEGVPMTINDLVKTSGHSYHAIDSILRRRRGTAFHIDSYTRISTFGDVAARWMVGGGKDAERPPRKSPSQSCREYRLRQQLKRGGFNPFLTIAQQVAE